MLALLPSPLQSPQRSPRTEQRRPLSSSGARHAGNLSGEGAGSRDMGRCLGKVGTEEHGRNKLGEMG